MISFEYCYFDVFSDVMYSNSLSFPVHAYVCVRAYVCVCVHAYVCVYVHAYVFVYVHAYVCVDVSS